MGIYLVNKWVVSVGINTIANFGEQANFLGMKRQSIICAMEVAAIRQDSSSGEQLLCSQHSATGP